MTKQMPQERRSAKAGSPPRPSVSSARVRRRARSATVAVKKDTTLEQTTEAPRAAWSGSRPSWKKS